MPEPQIPSRDTVEAVCEAKGLYDCSGLAFDDNFWIKYGTGATMGEAAMQQHVHSKADPRLVRVPKVFDAWRIEKPGGLPLTFIIMENFEGDNGYNATYDKEYPERLQELVQQVATAVRHIWDLPLPDNLTNIGPLENEIPYDRFFGDGGPGRTFESLASLETWVNDQLKEARYEYRVDLQNEPLQICHCDVTIYNLKLGQPIALVDWGFSGIYPRAFEEFALVHQWNLAGAKFAKALHKELFGEKPTKAMAAFSRAARYNQFSYINPAAASDDE